MAGWLSAAAHINAVWPRHCSTALTLAPLAQQGPGGVHAAGAGHDHQRRLTVAVRRLDIGAGLQELLDHVRVAGDGRFRHGRCAVVVLRVHLRAGPDEALREIEIVLMDRPVERGRAIGFGRIHIDAPADQGDCRGSVSRFDRVHERRGGNEQECEDCTQHRSSLDF
jgi:hypothetical protein